MIYLIASLALLLLSLILHYRAVALNLSEVAKKRHSNLESYARANRVLMRSYKELEASGRNKVKELREISDNALLRMADMEARYDELVERADKNIQERCELEAENKFLRDKEAVEYQENRRLCKEIEAKDANFDVLRESLKASNKRNRELKEKWNHFKDAWRQLRSLDFSGDKVKWHGEEIGTFSEIKQTSHTEDSGRRFKKIEIRVDLDEAPKIDWRDFPLAWRSPAVYNGPLQVSNT